MDSRWSSGGVPGPMNPPPAATICQAVGLRQEKSSSGINVDLMVARTGVARDLRVLVIIYKDYHMQTLFRNLIREDN